MPGFLTEKDECMDNGKYTFHDYCEVSTCGGVIDWYRAKTCVGKLFWTLILIITFVLTAFNVYGAFVNFLEPENRFQTVITMKTGLGDGPFPNVTVCNFNRVNTSKMIQKNITDKRLFEFAFAALPVNYYMALVEFTHVNAFKHMPVEYANNWRSFVDARFNGSEPSVAQLLHDFGHDCESTIVGMAFQTKKFLNPCEKAHEIITNFGRCYTFDMRNLRQTLPGIGMGLQMIINPALDFYLNGSIVSNYLEEGVLLSFDYTQEPLIADPVVVAPGTTAFISLKLSEQKYADEQFPLFKKRCTPEAEAKLDILKGDYSKRLCNYECILKEIWKFCHCIPPMNAGSDYRICYMNETMSCYAPFLGDVDQKFIDETINHDITVCSENCLDPCKGYSTVHTSVSTARFPVSSSIPELRNFITGFKGGHFSENGMRIKDLISINAYFPVMEVLTVTTSEATPIFEFIGNLGGQLGMWTGMCIMTVVQAIYFVLACIFQKKACRKPNIRQKIQMTEMENVPK